MRGLPSALMRKPWVLLGFLIFQAVLYWMLVIYIGSEAVPVAYQRF